jgi:hypothetical protein
MTRRPPTPDPTEPPSTGRDPNAATLAERLYGQLTPRSRLGWWALGLAGGFVALNLAHGALAALLPAAAPMRGTLLPPLAGVMLGAGLAAGGSALLALRRRGDRSPLLLVPLTAGLFSAIFLLGRALG